ncbi:MAG: hypothetical protein ACI8XO_002975 [Verrucomicrobiales bacterium]|jgi:hypothetical protein
MSGCFSSGGQFCGGNFLGGINYLGVEFDIAGNTHYGWVEIDINEYTARIDSGAAREWAKEINDEKPRTEAEQILRQ